MWIFHGRIYIKQDNIPGNDTRMIVENEKGRHRGGGGCANKHGQNK